MSKVYRMTSFFIYDSEEDAMIEWEALIVTIPRSYKLDVWASPKGMNYELDYRGRFTPTNAGLVSTEELIEYEEGTIYVEAERYIRKVINLKS